VISNIASGETGRLLAEEARKLSAEVTLLLGPVGELKTEKGIRILRFNYFSELYSLIRKELSGKKYDAVIHSAAVSDYQPKISFKHKIKSGAKVLGLELSPTLRIVDKIKKISPATFLVAFKLEFGLTKNKLIAEARQLLKRSRADLVVANTFDKNRYRAYIFNGEVIKGPLLNKRNLAKKLIHDLGESL